MKTSLSPSYYYPTYTKIHANWCNIYSYVQHSLKVEIISFITLNLQCHSNLMVQAIIHTLPSKRFKHKFTLMPQLHMYIYIAIYMYELL